MASVLVAGGAGFIGSHLCDCLLARGDRVVCVDDFVTGSRQNVEHLLDNANFELLEQDVTKEFSIGYGLDQVYNLASPASPVDYQERPVETLKAGSLGVKNLLELARQKKAVYLFASTSEVYGSPLEHPQRESYWGNVNCIGPRSCYDESKRFGEALCVAYRNVFGLDVKIARIFNTYGPRMAKDDGRVVPNFIQQALTGRPITVYGRGVQTRSFCYVSDMVEGIYRLMNSQEQGPVNLGNPYEITVLELAKLIVRLTASSSGISYTQLPGDDPERRLPDIALASQKLGWEPTVQLEDGLKRTIEFFSK